MRIRIAPGFWTSRLGIGLLAGMLALLLVATSVFAYYYIQFGHLIDQRLTGQIYQNTSRVYSAPGHIFTGETMRAGELDKLSAARRVSGKRPSRRARVNSERQSHTVEIRPSAASYFQGHNALRVDFTGTEISHIAQLPDGAELDSARR